MTSAASFRRRTQVALIALLTLLGVGVAGTAAQAHDVLISSEPGEGAELEEAPEQIVLTFNNAPLDVGSVITVVDAEGATVAEGEGSVEGTDVVLPLDGDVPAGELEVQWRVASSDGHPIEGVIPFTVAEQAEPEPTEEPPATEEEPAQDPVAEDTATEETAEDTAEETEAAEEPVTTEASTDDEDGGLPTWAAVLIGVAALGAVAGLVVLVTKRLRSTDES